MFDRIFAYHRAVNDRLLYELDSHGHELPERSYPLFCHILNAHQIWNARILNRPPFGVRDVHTYDDCSDIIGDNHRDTLTILEQFDLETEIAYVNSRGDAFTNTVSDILFHVANHTTHHRGQLIADFRASGIDPIVTDYIVYRRND
ncbi:putative damage-inducible protein DinB [Neolewinella xylanilytica]|uniref:Putative damage-inducible protein DinB n=1 Tax=Neolewinella xylanilytica TaxID=1514080 RepID=A0A2S6I7B5_9BACT|nr:DinB family protein [Neolewinella xylanilytica]PPK87357.1 putative damage-inducible protein DinB [Neolewinella xylanilytica]